MKQEALNESKIEIAIQDTYVRRAVELKQGDIICLRKTDDIPILKLRDIYNFETGTKISLSYEVTHPVQGQVTKLIKNPPYKKWYQFWKKQQVIGYLIQII